MSAVDDVYVDVRIKVRSSVYRQLFAEAQRRRLDGAGELVEHMLHRRPLPAPQPAPEPVTRERWEPVERAVVDACLERVEAGELSVRAAARELGVSRGAVYWWQQRAKAEAATAEHAAHAAQLDELGVVGRPAVPDPTVPSVP
jgi:DNA invertase Pin-like site-specific DNA recombinase